MMKMAGYIMCFWGAVFVLLVGLASLLRSIYGIEISELAMIRESVDELQGIVLLVGGLVVVGVSK